MSKNTKIILAVVGVLVVVGVARYAVQSRSIAGDVVASKSLNGDSTYTFKSEDGQGTVTSGNSVPKDFPSDVTVYAGSNVLSSYSGVNAGAAGHVLNLETSDSADVVIDFYSKSLVAAGWKIVSTYNVDSAKMLMAQKGEMNIIVNATTESGKTNIVLTVASK